MHTVTELGVANITAAWHAYASRARYLQWGVGTGQDASDNDLADKSATTEARSEGTTSQQTTIFPSDTLRIIGTITAEGARAITEVGVFDGAGTGTPPSGDNMCMYGDFATINLAAADSVTFAVEVQFA